MEHTQAGVLQHEKGILIKDGIYFHTPSEFARQHLFYLTFGAQYTCDKPYVVRHTSFDAFILFYIRSGSMSFQYEDGKPVTAHSGDVVFLSCLRPHLYRAEERCEFYWFHFNGAATKAYFDRLNASHGFLFTDLTTMEQYFNQIQRMLRSGNVDDDLISFHIHRILSTLSYMVNPIHNLSPAIAEAQRYIEKHYQEKLSIEEIASRFSFSSYYFTRLFHKETGISPYNYLISVRLDHAKYLLAETDKNLDDIAEECAFCSATNFIRAFRQNIGMTPTHFRNLF